jgi:prolyl oligopeptidase
MCYPASPAIPSQITLAGLAFDDPYRWLEQESDATLRWQRAQAALAAAEVAASPHHAAMEEAVGALLSARRVALPRHAADRWYRTEASGERGTVVVCSQAPFGEGEVLFSTEAHRPGATLFVSWIAPSPDGALLALGLCDDGSEANRILLVDTATRQLLDGAPPQRLMDSRAGGVQWLADARSFFFTALAGAATDFDQQVFVHRRLPEPHTEPCDIPWVGSRECRAVIPSADGRYAVALERMNDVIPVAVAALGEGPLRWRPFLRKTRGTVAGQIVGSRYIAMTDVGAPRGRVVAIPLDAADPDDSSQWIELVAESEAVLRSVAFTGAHMYMNELVDTYSRIRVQDLTTGATGIVPLPAQSVISDFGYPFGNALPRQHGDHFLFALGSLTRSWAVYQHTPGTAAAVQLTDPAAALGDVVVEDRDAVSRDGTRIPYHVVRPADLPAGVPAATLLYAYGGFNVPLLPQFPGAMGAFVRAGGVFVHAHLRGGGEFGRDWWNAGRFEQKQNCYDDLYAVAEDLIASGQATPATLAVTGESNGGLMAGVAATQRPDLWAAAVLRVPRLDLIGACETAYGRNSTLEDRARSLDDPAEIARLAGYSPYHQLRAGIAYPAVYAEAGATDPRCPPQDARKFIAKLQTLSPEGAPALLHVWENAGHGWATSRDVEVRQYAAWLTFALKQLGGALAPSGFAARASDPADLAAAGTR